MEWMEAFAKALASRPEVAGMVAFGFSMAWLVRQKRQRNSGPIFRMVIQAQLVGVCILGVALIARTVGWQVVRVLGCGN